MTIQETFLLWLIIVSFARSWAFQSLCIQSACRGSKRKGRTSAGSGVTGFYTTFGDGNEEEEVIGGDS
jgi:hypothetical protein